MGKGPLHKGGYFGSQSIRHVKPLRISVTFALLRSDEFHIDKRISPFPSVRTEFKCEYGDPIALHPNYRATPIHVKPLNGQLMPHQVDVLGNIQLLSDYEALFECR